MSILNAKRLRDYPRLMLVTTWLILVINLLFRQGWIGAFGQVIGGDFIMFYSTGLIYRVNPSLIYDYDTQLKTQQNLVAPSVLPGYNPYMNPPFVAPLYALLSFISLNWAIILWTILAILCVFLSAYMLYKLYSPSLEHPKVPYGQLVIISLSFFPFIEGLQAGQNHWLTLLLVTGVVYAMFKEKWYLAGALAGLLIYKPQFVIGFLVIWLMWRNLKSILSFGLVAVCWTGLFALANGFTLYKVYLQLSQVYMSLPYIPGFPNYLMVTFYGLMTSIFPQTAQTVLSTLSQVVAGILVIGLAWLAYRYRQLKIAEKIPVIVLALLFPLLATPYALLHDLVILIPAFVLLFTYSNRRETLYAAIIFYFGAFILTFVAALTKIAWVSLLVIGLCAALTTWTGTKPKLAMEMGAVE